MPATLDSVFPVLEADLYHLTDHKDLCCQEEAIACHITGCEVYVGFIVFVMQSARMPKTYSRYRIPQVARRSESKPAISCPSSLGGRPSLFRNIDVQTGRLVPILPCAVAKRRTRLPVTAAVCPLSGLSSRRLREFPGSSTRSIMFAHAAD